MSTEWKCVGDKFCHVFFQLLCLIGEAFGDHSDQVNGAVVQIRNKGDKLAIWTSNASDQEATLTIG